MVSHLPTLNACLNAASAVFLVAGLIAVKRKAIEAHKRLMVTAFAVSCLFLISYLAYHGLKGGVVTRFQGEGWIRPVYFGILISHTLLAAAVPFLAVFTIRYGLRCFLDRRVLERSLDIDRHKRWARWTFPIWLYVSVTGVVIYWMLYHLYPEV